MSHTNKQKSLIPFAILAAGILIAGALYFTNNNSSTTTNTDPGKEITIPKAKKAETVKVPALRKTDHVRGPRDAKLVIIEYSDPECPFCKMYHETLKKVVNIHANTKDVAWVYRHFPLTQLHSKAVDESIALECAAIVGGEDTFWKYTDTVYKNSPGNNKLEPEKLNEFAQTVGLDLDKFTKCRSGEDSKKRVDASLKEAISTGGRGTPYAIILYKGKELKLPGAIPLEDYQDREGATQPGMKTIIDSVLSQ